VWKSFAEILLTGFSYQVQKCVFRYYFLCSFRFSNKILKVRVLKKQEQNAMILYRVLFEVGEFMHTTYRHINLEIIVFDAEHECLVAHLLGFVYF